MTKNKFKPGDVVQLVGMRGCRRTVKFVPGMPEYDRRYLAASDGFVDELGLWCFASIYSLVKSGRKKELCSIDEVASWSDSKWGKQEVYKKYLMGTWLETDNKTIMQKLTTTLKRILSPGQQTMYKAGFINGNLELTETGKQALLSHLRFEHEASLVKLAQEVLDEEKEEKK